MQRNQMSEFMKASITKIKEMVDVNTVVGDAISGPDGITLIPISKVSFGFASGGSDTKRAGDGVTAGSGAGIKIEPICFLLIKDGVVRTMSIQPPASNSLDRIVDLIPQLMDRADDIKAKKAEM
ncbi:MAG: sporulation protein YtfJ [Ruminococcaceae bacterium]|nr:sporulation protein YtfJ [Oscillospiraceae bacterium]